MSEEQRLIKDKRMRLLGPILAAIAAGYWLAVLLQPAPWRPLTFVNPQLVKNSPVPAGGAVVVVGEKCNDSGAAVAVRGAVYLVHLSPRVPTLLMRSEGVRDPGCTTATWANHIPQDTAPGTYRLEGIEQAEEGARVQRGAWFTEAFEVVAP